MKKFPKIFVLCVLIILFTPILLTFLYSISTKWSTSILPQGLTLKWYGELFRNYTFIDSLFRTLFVSAASVILSIVIMVPTVYLIVFYFKEYERLLKIVSILPFAVPGIIYSVGIVQIYSKPPFDLTGTVWILILAFFIFILPMMYQGIRNSLRNINVNEFIEAAELLGATKTQGFFKVILPNILPGILVSSLLGFSMLFGEFVIANFLVGSSYETVQIYLMNMLNSATGQLSSAVVISYFVFILIITSIAIKITHISNKKDRKIKDVDEVTENSSIINTLNIEGDVI